MLSEIRDLFFGYSPWLVVIPAAWLLFWGGNWDRKLFLPLKIYLIISVFTQAASLYLWLRHINNLPLLHFYTLIEFILLAVFFHKLLPVKFNRQLLFLTIGLFSFFAILDSLVIENIHAFNIYTRTLESLVIILLSTIWFIQRISGDRSTESGYKKGYDYLVTGFFIYFAGSIMLFAFSNLTTKLTYSFALNVWSVHSTLLFLLYIFILSGLYKCRIK